MFVSFVGLLGDFVCVFVSCLGCAGFVGCAGFMGLVFWIFWVLVGFLFVFLVGFIGVVGVGFGVGAVCLFLVFVFWGLFCYACLCFLLVF